LQESRLGRPRLEALYEMVSAPAVEELNNFIQAVIQSSSSAPGSSVSSAFSRRDKAEAPFDCSGARREGLAEDAPPDDRVIFPTLWIICWAPAGCSPYKAFRGGLALCSSKAAGQSTVDLVRRLCPHPDPAWPGRFRSAFYFGVGLRGANARRCAPAIWFTRHRHEPLPVDGAIKSAVDASSVSLACRRRSSRTRP